MSKIQFKETEPDTYSVEFGAVERGAVFRYPSSSFSYMKLRDGQQGQGRAARLCDGWVVVFTHTYLVEVAKSAKMEIEW